MILLPAALAATPTLTPGGVAVGGGVVAEILDDVAITEVYGGTTISGELSATASFPRGIEATFTVGYHRLGGAEIDATGAPGEASTWLWYVPATVTGGAAWNLGRASIFGAAGPAVVAWAEQPSLDSGVGYSGGKLGLALDGGVRVPIARVAPSLYAPEAGPRGADVVVDVGYRAMFRRHAGCAEDGPCGLDFSAIRASVGVRARF